jgi:branched-subunit amino acid aminotransferase/4-amino-4-deoxychorismate lyase
MLYHFFVRPRRLVQALRLVKRVHSRTLASLMTVPHDTVDPYSLNNNDKNNSPMSSPVKHMTPSLPMTQKPQHAWCCTAYMEDGCGSLQRVSGYDDTRTDLPYLQSIPNDTTTTSDTLDLTTSPDWMHYMQTHHAATECPGVYDTLRCDFVWHTPPGQCPWNVWGEAFHLDRLQRSFRSLVLEQQQGNEYAALTTPRTLERAVMESKLLFRALLQEASVHPLIRSYNTATTMTPDHDWSWSTLTLQIIKCTWMWSPTRDYQHIAVRAHACSTTQPVHISMNHMATSFAPIQACIVLPSQPQQEQQTLPSRWDRNAHVKVARWTRERQSIPMPTGMGEVLLVRPYSDGTTGEPQDYELLEGLSSNLFVVYRNGELRTAHDGVLSGYVRHLVLTSAEALQIPVNREPILLSHADQWKEAFITSSTRLLYPIQRIHCSTTTENDTTAMKEVWHDEYLCQAHGDASTTTGSTPKWQQLLEEVWRRSGYSKLG